MKTLFIWNTILIEYIFEKKTSNVIKFPIFRMLLCNCNGVDRFIGEKEDRFFDDAL